MAMVDIQSLFADIIESPRQRRQAMQAQGQREAQIATNTLSGRSQIFAPLVAQLAASQGSRDEMLQRSVGGLFGLDTRNESEKLQQLLSEAKTPEQQAQLPNTLRQMGYGQQAMALEQQLAEQARSLEDRALNQQLQQGELGLQQQRMSLAEQEQRSREEQLRLQAARDAAQLNYQGFQIQNEQEQLRIAEMNAELRAEEIEMQRQANIARLQQQTDQTNRFIKEATDEALEQRTNATSLLSVAKQYENVQPRAGIFGSSAAAFREFLGTQGGEDAVKQQYLRLRNSDVINSLPPGAASDRDITIFMGGWPPENASADYIAQFVRGQAKAATIAAELNAAKASYIAANNGNVAGFYELWTEKSADPNFLDDVQEKYGVSFAAEDDEALRQSLLESMSLGQGRRTNTNR